jgi:hypothetical protein
MVLERVKRLWPLLALGGLVLFPFGWLGEVWPPFGRVLDWGFATKREHAVGHSIMFGLLGLLLLTVFPLLQARLGLYLGAILAAGIGQETFQLLYKNRPLVFDDFRDLAVDLTAALLVFLAVRLCRQVRQRRHA